MSRLASARRAQLCADTDHSHADRKERHSAVLSGRSQGSLSFMRFLDALRLCVGGLLFALGFIALLWIVELAAFQ